MITPRVNSVPAGRADFNELTLLHDGRVCLDDGAHMHIRVWRAPDDSPVLHLVLGQARATIKLAAEIGRNVQFPDRSHVFVNSFEYEEGFDTTLDQRLPDGIKLTLVEHVPDPPEVGAVPWPTEATPVTVPLTISEADFDRLTGESGMFAGDFVGLESVEWWDPERGSDFEPEDVQWSQMYTVEARYGHAQLMMVRAFLQGQKQAYEMATDNDGDMYVLTNFKTAWVRRSEEQDRVRARLKLEAAEASGDELAMAFHMPAAEKDDKEQSNDE